MEREEKERKTAQQKVTNILDMPEVILVNIISLLPTKSAAQTACVSKKWRELWSSLPDWSLEYSSFPNVISKNEKFISFVNRVIYFHQGPSIKSMKIHYSQYDSTTIHVREWIRHLVENNIVTLDINVYEPVQIPFSLFICETLAELRLVNFFKELPLLGNVFLPNLKVLYLKQTKFSYSVQVEKLMNGCPVLENLHMKGCTFFDTDFNHIKISHPNINSLKLIGCGGFEALKIYIWMPKLSEFRFRGTGLVDQRGKIDISSLNMAVLDAEDILYTYRHSMMEGLTASYGPNMSHILASVSHASKLALSDWCIEYLSAIPRNLNFVSSNTLELLDLKMWPNGGHFYVVTELLKCYPKVQSLSISFIDNDCVSRNNWGNSDGIFDEEREDYPQPPDVRSAERVHHNLRILKIIGCKGYSEELRMMQFLLQIAVVLEKFNVEICKCIRPWTVRNLVEFIQVLPRASEVVQTSIYIVHPQ